MQIRPFVESTHKSVVKQAQAVLFAIVKESPRYFYDDGFVKSRLFQDAKATSDVLIELTNALEELMKYIPRFRYVGGIENGAYIKEGEAVCKVLDRCELLLKEVKS